MRAQKVTITGRDRKLVKNIYTHSFEKREQMPYWMMLLMAKLWNTELFSFYEGDRLCGMMYLAKTRNLAFVMFFAVDASLRSQGYGSAILDEIQAMYPNKKIIVSIERCDVEATDIEQRRRRKKFYLANGYKETGYMVQLAGIKQEVIIRNGEFDKKEFLLFFVLYSNGVMWPKIWKQV